MSVVEVERNGAVAILRLNQPQLMNAFSPEITAAFFVHFPPLVNETSVRCIVITGAGNAFCAGGDVRSMNGDRSAPHVRNRLRGKHEWIRKVVTCDKPVIAAVNGAAAGAGFGLAALCDFILVSDRGFFNAAFPRIGAAPDLGLAYTLPRLVGVQRAKEILMANRRIDADEAVEIGLALRKVSAAKLLNEAMSLATTLANGPAVSLGLTKALVNEAFDTPFESFLNKEAMAQAIAFGSTELAEGVSAFLQKRKPRFFEQDDASHGLKP